MIVVMTEIVYATMLFVGSLLVFLIFAFLVACHISLAQYGKFH